MQNLSKNKIISASVLVILGILFRMVWHLGPNVEFVTTATLLAASYLGRRWAIIVPLMIMMITDLFIGNSNIFIFTWSGYTMIGLAGSINHKWKMENGKWKIVKASSLGIVASLWFYLWTNFGVWLLDAWGMYPRTLVGLLDCYILALPFLKYNLIGNLVFVPVSFGIVEISKSLYWQIRYSNIESQKKFIK